MQKPFFQYLLIFLIYFITFLWKSSQDRLPPDLSFPHLLFHDSNSSPINWCQLADHLRCSQPWSWSNLYKGLSFYQLTVQYGASVWYSSCKKRYLYKIKALYFRLLRTACNGRNKSFLSLTLLRDVIEPPLASGLNTLQPLESWKLLETKTQAFCSLK